jgi:hypothetical protein
MLKLLAKFRYQKLTIAILLGIAAQSSILLPVYSQNFSDFFQSGRLRSEDRIIFRAPPNDTIPVSKNSRSWQFIVFQSGGFSFWMPPGILTEETVVLNTSVGSLSFRTLAANGEDRRYVVAYAEKLTPAQLQSPQVLLEAIRDKVAPANQFQLKQQREITIDKYPGRELILENDKEIIIFRAYLAKEKVYVLGVHTPKANPLNRETQAFFNAFQLL